MNHRLGVVLPLATLIAAGSAAPVNANTDFWDSFITNVSTVPGGAGPGQSSARAVINAAEFRATWTDTNSDGKFGSSDTLTSFYIYDRNHVAVLSAPPNVATRDELVMWADRNFVAILNAIFPYGVSEITGNSDDSMMASATVSNNLFDKTVAKRPGSQQMTSSLKGQVSSDSKALTAANVSGQTRPGVDGQLNSGVDGKIASGVDAQSSSGANELVSKKAKGELDAEVKGELHSEVNAQVEYLDLKVNDNKGGATSIVLGYATEADSGLNFSLTVPYSYSSIKDDIHSKSHFIGLDLALNYPVQKWDKGTWKVGGALFGSAYYLKTDTIEKSGNLKYGWGLFTSASQDLGFGTLGVGMDYRIGKAYLPSGMNSDNTFLVNAVNYINNLDPVHTLSYGINLGVPLLNDTAAINLEILRSNFISDDIPDDQKNKTGINLSGSYFPSDSFELNMGLRYDFELKNVKTLGVMLGAVKRF